MIYDRGVDPDDLILVAIGLTALVLALWLVWHIWQLAGMV